ncbi:MAG: class I SAM-dependent methyltransferase, partial [Lachnospiraceae bacterium]|nr:class I SAM-dependent methyltransferase [Lachnospiraceae bacterium]
MDEVNKTLYIPLYGKAWVSKQNMILKDKMAEKIWESQGFQLGRKSKSKWLCYNMAMRARIFDDWADTMLKEHKDALVVHVGCGLDG